MKIYGLISAVEACSHSQKNKRFDKEVHYGFCSDLMSDTLMMNNTADEEMLSETVLITGLCTHQAIRAASILGIDIILFVQGKTPSTQVVDAAEESNIMLLGTKKTMFETSGILFEHGIGPVHINTNTNHHLEYTG